MNCGVTVDSIHDNLVWRSVEDIVTHVCVFPLDSIVAVSRTSAVDIISNNVSNLRFEALDDLL